VTAREKPSLSTSLSGTLLWSSFWKSNRSDCVRFEEKEAYQKLLSSSIHQNYLRPRLSGYVLLSAKYLWVFHPFPHFSRPSPSTPLLSSTPFCSGIIPKVDLFSKKSQTSSSTAKQGYIHDYKPESKVFDGDEPEILSEKIFSRPQLDSERRAR
jgi:hypothetical protein